MLPKKINSKCFWEDEMTTMKMMSLGEWRETNEIKAMKRLKREALSLIRRKSLFSQKRKEKPELKKIKISIFSYSKPS